MRYIAIFATLSLRYWKIHRKRILTLAVVCVLGAAALCFSIYYIRSEKAFVLERELNLLGDYDAVFFGIEEKDISLILENEEVTAAGFYRELGYVSVDGGSKYKVASFPDEESIQMYHMSCIEGDYPKEANEIAIDAGTAKKFGIAPIPGQIVTLDMFDLEKNEFGDREYIISGIFEASSESVYGGFYRYPVSLEDYDVPAVFVSEGGTSVFDSSRITVFIQTEDEISRFVAHILNEGFFESEGAQIPPGRAYAYAYILGITGHISSEYGELTISSLFKAIKDGNVWKDFYSSVLIPLFALLILVIVAVSVFGLVRNIIMERSREIAILRSIGATKQVIFLYLFVELLLFVSLFLLAGIILGSILHYCLIEGMNACYGMNMPLGFGVNSYVASVTPQPLLYAISVIGISSITAIFLPLFRMSESTPVAIFQKKYWGRRNKKCKHYTDFSKCTWKTVISDHIQFYDTFVLVIMGIIMSTAFFGYNYFRALSDRNNIEYQHELTENGLVEWDFVAEKNAVSSYEFLIENHHDYGIEEKAYQDFAGTEFIDDSFARIVNRSTRLTYFRQEGSEEIQDFLSPFYMRKYDTYETSGNTYERTEYEAETAMIKSIGYSFDENVYALPSIGVLEEDLASLHPYVKEGQIHMENIQNGSEVVLVVPAEMEEEARGLFHVGESLPLSDIVLSEEEETYNFNQISPFDYAKPVYLRFVEDPGGETVRYASFAFGARKNIDTQIGAIVVLNDEMLLARYTLPYQEIMGLGSKERLYTLSILCLPDTFASWGLPDSLFTEAQFSINEGADLSEANEQFYQMLGASSGISFQSSFEIRERMEINTRNTMAVYYIMIFMLIFLGIIAVGIKFYSKVKLQSQTIARLRAIGMSLSQLEELIFQQNVAYPLIGGALATIPTCLCQMFFMFIRHQIDTGIWSGIFMNDVPWWYYVPFRYSLFGYHPVIVLLIIVFVFEVFIIMATVPQILYMRKQIIAETIDMDSF